MFQVTKRNLVALGIAGALTGMAFTATAAPFVFDPGAVAGPGGPVNVNAFDADEITITAIGTAPISVTDANDSGELDTGDTFAETGLIAAVNFQLNNANVFDTGIGVNYELLAEFNLSGDNTLLPNGDVEVDITGGGGIVYFDQDLNNMIGADESQIGTFSAALGDCSITAASGLSQGSCVVNFKFISDDEGVWSQNGFDLTDLELDATLIIDINVDQLSPAIAVFYPGGPGSTQTVQSDFDGSARIESRPVPEPGTLGLLALVFIGVASNKRSLLARRNG